MNGKAFKTFEQKVERQFDQRAADAAEKRRETEGRIDKVGDRIESAEDLLKEKASQADKLKEQLTALEQKQSKDLFEINT